MEPTHHCSLFTAHSVTQSLSHSVTQVTQVAQVA